MVMQQIAYNAHDVERPSSILFALIVESDTISGKNVRENLRRWQSPSDPSTNHNIACSLQHEGTAEWFCDGNVFEEWKVGGSLLWIHGKRTLLFPLMALTI